MDPWGLITAGQYEEAADAYTVVLRARESSPNFCNRGIAHLNQGLLDRAMLDFEAAERCRPANVARSDGYRQWIGTTHWLGGAERQAGQIWLELVEGLESGKIGYTDAAGGVESGALLWFAAAWLQDADLLARARRWLGRLCRSRRTVWPAPIGLFLLGRITADELLPFASDVPVLHERQACQAHFFDAVAGRTMPNARTTTVALDKAAGLSEAKLEQTWYLARYELSRLPLAGGA
jgi:hypothetical protein